MKLNDNYYLNGFSTNTIGIGCNYIDGAITFPLTAAGSLAGFPNFIANMESASSPIQITSFHSLADGENSADITTDNGGNVFVTGHIAKGSSFHGSENDTIVIDVDSDSTFFVAKFSSCGGLEWINYCTNPGIFSKGTGITMDINRNRIYVVGNYNHTNTNTGLPLLVNGQMSGQGPGVSVTMGAASRTAFIAAFDASTGAIMNYYEGTAPQYLSNVFLRSVDLFNNNGTQTNIFVGGYSIQGVQERAFLGRLYETGNTFTAPTVLPVSTASSRARINDLEVINNRVYITGEFSGTMFLNTSSITTSSTIDGFKAGLNPLTMSLYAGYFSAFANQPTVVAQGTGVSIAPDNTVTFIGNYKGNVTNAFGSGQPLAGNTSFYRAYICKYNSTNGILWSKQFNSSSTGNVYSTGIASNPTGLYVCGYWTRGMLNGLASGDHSTSPILTKRIYNIELDPANGNIVWQNTTTDPNNTNHIPSRIAADDYTTYLTGKYRGVMSYYSPVSSLPSLVSSYATAHNMFVLKNEIVGGNFRSVQLENVDEIGNISPESIFEDAIIYPNPTNGILNIEMMMDGDENLNSSVLIYDITGKLIQSVSMNNENIQLDLSSFKKGLYILELRKGLSSKRHKVILN